jgi:hypothetical protein
MSGWKTLIGLVVAVVGQVLAMKGLDLDVPAVTDAIGATLDNVVTLVGVVIALYGRIKANSPMVGFK